MSHLPHAKSLGAFVPHAKSLGASLAELQKELGVLRGKEKLTAAELERISVLETLTASPEWKAETAWIDSLYREATDLKINEFAVETISTTPLKIAVISTNKSSCVEVIKRVSAIRPSAVPAELVAEERAPQPIVPITLHSESDQKQTDDADDARAKENEKKSDEWLSKFDLYQTVHRLRLSDRENRKNRKCGFGHIDLPEQVEQTALALLKKKKDEQYDARMSLEVLKSDYPVVALRGQHGVIANAKISKAECIAIYEGALVRCTRNFTHFQRKYSMILISDHPLPDDPAWEDYQDIEGVMYYLDASMSKNLARLVNDPKDHPSTMPVNTVFLECMTDREYPVTLMVTIRDIEKNQPILVDYQTNDKLF